MSIIVAFGLLLPDAWLSSRVKRRIAKVEQQLPGAIDSLRIGVEAGKSIEDAMADYADTYPGVIATEFRNFRRDISLQKPRVEALLALGNRCGSQSAKSFCATIIQSELSGQEVAPILKAQASTIRVMRKEYLTKIANELPSKMSLPMITIQMWVLIGFILIPVLAKAGTTGGVL
ncbi:MAG: type II secretion system F family protein [Raoultibacter sp.]